jgi:hypothetical protein
MLFQTISCRYYQPVVLLHKTREESYSQGEVILFEMDPMYELLITQLKLNRTDFLKKNSP